MFKNQQCQSTLPPPPPPFTNQFPSQNFCNSAKTSFVGTGQCHRGKPSVPANLPPTTAGSAAILPRLHTKGCYSSEIKLVCERERKEENSCISIDETTTKFEAKIKAIGRFQKCFCCWVIHMYSKYGSVRFGKISIRYPVNFLHASVPWSQHSF